MRLFYVYPSAERPAGGLKQIRLQASLLASLGHQIFLLRDDNFFREPKRFEDQHYYNIDKVIGKLKLSGLFSIFQRCNEFCSTASRKVILAKKEFARYEQMY